MKLAPLTCAALVLMAHTARARTEGHPSAYTAFEAQLCAIMRSYVDTPDSPIVSGHIHITVKGADGNKRGFGCDTSKMGD